MIVMQKLVKVDGKVRTDLNFPAGFMDVIELDKSNERFRMLYDTKGRFVLHQVPLEEAKYKMARVVSEMKMARGVPAVVTHDGRTLRYPDPTIKKNDTVKIDLSTGKVRCAPHCRLQSCPAPSSFLRACHLTLSPLSPLFSLHTGGRHHQVCGGQHGDGDQGAQHGAHWRAHQGGEARRLV